MRSCRSVIRSGRIACVAVLLAACSVQAQNAADPLESGFQDPPDSAKPRVWWHWMNGNITKEGIKLDLEWMKRIGIGGFQNFDAALATPQVVEKRLVYMTPEWKDAFRYAATLADQLGLEMAIAGSPGWSETGGPWVPPAQAMKKLVWSETVIEGGKPFTGKLPKPPSTTGPFQNIPRAAGFNIGGGKPAPLPEYYADSIVIAFPLAYWDTPMAELHPKITSSGGRFDLAALTDGDFAKTSSLPVAPPGKKAWIQFEFAKPQAICAITLATGRAAGMFETAAPGGEVKRELEAGDDGVQFKVIATIPGGGVGSRTVAFPAVTAKFFRVAFTSPKPTSAPKSDDTALEGSFAPQPTNAHRIAELVLHTAARVHRFEEKAGFAVATDLTDSPTPAAPPSVGLAKWGFEDLTSRMRPDGSLDWTPEDGRWIVFRMGFSLTGARNSPASPEATGLEVDKLSRTFVKTYLDNYLGSYKSILGDLMGKRGLQYVITDSWEAGVQNWTDNMISEFMQRRGYDMRPWLPVLTGRVMGSSEQSDRFLWDFRKTIAELTAQYHYGQISASLHELGMGRYSESHESGRAFIADGMEVKQGADIPMSAYWTQRSSEGVEQAGYNADVRESASVAHIYGQNLVAAESLTAGSGAWAWSPEMLKPTADIEMAMGLNRFVIHTSVHQPVSDRIPGLSLGPFGQWFTRHETWAEQAKPWISYLARSSFMLQQGTFAADILYFYGEDSNITALFSQKAPAIPAGYNFDYLNADALVNRLSVTNGWITTESGMAYRVLVLDPRCRTMSLPVLRKIRDMVRQGAIIVGAKPAATPSLGDLPQEFQNIANEVWGTGDGEHPYGSGKTYPDRTVADVLNELHLPPDFEYSKPQGDTRMLFVHRKLPGGGDIYWVNNRNARAETIDATFRPMGLVSLAPELWHPDTGKIEPVSYRKEGGRITVPLRLDPNDAVFVVFRKPADQQNIPVPVETAIAAIEGPWDVGFQPDRGAPQKITLSELSSWAENADIGVKYFSGTGTYTKTIQAPADWFSGRSRLWLDLGSVKNLAEVMVNGKSLGIVWKAPFRIDVTDALKPGTNALEIRVTNLWVNRLIGDAQPHVAKKYTYTTQQFYRANSPLAPSGLLGPVRILKAAID
ncbi:MAG TPA: glycosyl hydrolase [Acidobacteriota bacterium]|nr:glycosyl hydrolase [Acidobacteriota bacterium]